jgi:hypothetical protein
MRGRCWKHSAPADPARGGRPKGGSDTACAGVARMRRLLSAHRGSALRVIRPGRTAGYRPSNGTQARKLMQYETTQPVTFLPSEWRVTVP